MKTTSTLAVVLGFAVLVGGCRKAAFDPELAQERRELGEIYNSYMHYLKAHEQPPTDLSQLKQYQIINVAGFRALQEGKYQVVWGVRDKDAGTLLAYEAAAAEQGGVVLMADGTVQTMSAEQLQAAVGVRH